MVDVARLLPLPRDGLSNIGSITYVGRPVYPRSRFRSRLDALLNRLLIAGISTIASTLPVYTVRLFPLSTSISGTVIVRAPICDDQPVDGQSFYSELVLVSLESWPASPSSV